MKRQKAQKNNVNDREILESEILACLDRLDTERLRLLYITAKIWENKPE